MIRQILTTLFCVAVFTLIVWVIPAQASHKIISAPYVCTSLEAGMETVRFQEDGNQKGLMEKARKDKAFKCFVISARNIPFKALELVHEYTAYGVRKGMVRVLAPDGSIAYTFATMGFIDKLLHEQGT